YLQSHDLEPEMFNSYNWGGYLMFKLPQYRVFVDGRTDLYGDFVFVYRDIALALGDWRTLLEEYQIQFIVIEKNSPLDLALRDDGAWVLSYEDDLAVIWQRSATNE